MGCRRVKAPEGSEGGLDKLRSEFAPQGRGGNGVPTSQSPRGLGGGLDKPRSEFAPQGRGGNGVPTSQPIATRPLAIQKDGTWYTHGLDLTKNVCEVFGSTGYIATTYTYSPYGSVTTTGSVTQPVQWGSEIKTKAALRRSFK